VRRCVGGQIMSARIDIAGYSDEIGQRCVRQLFGHGVLGARPRNVNRARVLPCAGSATEHAVIKRYWTLGSFNNLEERDVFCRPGKDVAAGRPCHSPQEVVLNEFGKDLRQEAERNVHLPGYLASLAPLTSLPGYIEQGSHRVVALASKRCLHTASITLNV